MAGTAVFGRLSWQLAEVVGRIEETPRAVTLELDCPAWQEHLPGQHVDVRLTAEDGYQAQRSYSIATPPDGRRIALTIERIPDGEVSSYLADELRVGDQLELRGPIGGYFAWRPEDGGPLLLVAAGSGLVPLMAMLRSRVAGSSQVPVRLLLSARSLDEVIYRAELDQLAAQVEGVDVVLTLTRAQPPGWTGHARRVDRELLAAVAWPAVEEPRIFVCGPTGFVEAVASSLVELGYPAGRIRTERFGPSGG
jgi:ferredoxin-NADP reductase